MDCCVGSVGVVDLWLLGNKDRIFLKTALSLRRSFASEGLWALMALWSVGYRERPGKTRTLWREDLASFVSQDFLPQGWMIAGGNVRGYVLQLFWQLWNTRCVKPCIFLLLCCISCLMHFLSCNMHLFISHFCTMKTSPRKINKSGNWKNLKHYIEKA